MKLDYAHLALSVRDMEKSIAFCTEGLRLHKGVLAQG